MGLNIHFSRPSLGWRRSPACYTRVSLEILPSKEANLRPVGETRVLSFFTKKDDPGDHQGNRPIYLVCELHKLFRKTRISRTLDEAQPVEQAEFRKGFTFVDHTQTVPGPFMFAGNTVIPTFVDHKKASNSTEMNAVSFAFIGQGVDSSFRSTSDRPF